MAAPGKQTPWEWMLRAILRAEKAGESVLRRRAPDLGKAVIEPYRSYGTPETLHVKGRVLQERRLARAVSGDPAWRHLWQTIKRAFSREIPLAPIEARWKDRRVEGAADSEGYFHVKIEGVDASGIALWEAVEVRVRGAAEDRIAIAQVLVPPADADLGIVSDIDDTVIRTDATSLVRMLKTVLLQSAHVRLPFEGVAAFYRALHRGRNPIFYVSSGPWNLYDLLEHIFELRGIPHGPIFLQDWGIEPGKLVVASHEGHKREQIDTLVGTYPSLSFLLIGDSGQHDPEIYASVARHYRDRVRAIYIRDVSPGLRRDEVSRIAESLLRDTGIEMLLVADSLAAAKHAAERGWIEREALPSIAGEKAADEKAGASL